MELTSCIHNSQHNRWDPWHLAAGGIEDHLDLFKEHRDGFGEGIGEANADKSPYHHCPAPASFWRSVAHRPSCRWRHLHTHTLMTTTKRRRISWALSTLDQSVRKKEKNLEQNTYKHRLKMMIHTVVLNPCELCQILVHTGWDPIQGKLSIRTEQEHSMWMNKAWTQTLCKQLVDWAALVTI